MPLGIVLFLINIFVYVNFEKLSRTFFPKWHCNFAFIGFFQNGVLHSLYLHLLDFWCMVCVFFALYSRRVTKLIGLKKGD
jgi:hypothetical protein